MTAVKTTSCKVAFLDRDGTITVDIPGGYTHRIEDFAFERGAVEGIRMLEQQGFLLVITTGQSGIGRGYYTEEAFQQFMDHLVTQLSQEEITLSGIYHCPHHPTKAVGDYRISCGCRKPKTGMIDRAVTDLKERGYEVDLSESYVIGDKTDDGMMGNLAGCRSILVDCPSGKRGKDGTYSCTWAYEAKDLADAARWIESASAC